MTQLPFWHFFEQLETELSYERWISKYKLFLQALAGGFIEYDDEWLHFRRFCKTLLLQDHKDEKRFDELLDAARQQEEAELELLLLKWQQETPAAANTSQTPEVPENEGEEKIKNGGEKDVENNGADRNQPMIFNEEQQGGDDTDPVVKYYHPPTMETAAVPQPGSGKVPINFLHTDEYFSVSRREMVKGWQFLRRREAFGHGSKLDLPRTVAQIGKDGMFLQPVYEEGTRNREDTVIIFADYRGSMTPFHELADRLIETAKGEGGHARAPVYYFQNYPLGYVYEHRNLSGPIKVKEALLKANRNFTLAIVISDAGSARGNNNPQQVKDWVEITQRFLDALHESCAHVVWLNPMPAHRWRGTAAEAINENVFIMAPVLEEENYNFQDTLRVILKQNKPTLKL